MSWIDRYLLKEKADTSGEKMMVSLLVTIDFVKACENLTRVSLDPYSNHHLKRVSVEYGYRPTEGRFLDIEPFSNHGTMGRKSQML